MTIDELMNPEGRGSSAFHMKIIHENLQMRFEKNIQKTLKVVAYQSKDDYFFHVRIPSESNSKYDKEIFYDVILQFSPTTPEDIPSGSIRRYAVSAYSNSPSFTFTFTRTYKTHGILPKLVPTKFYNSVALHKAPVVRNPLDAVGIEKTIWFAGHYLISNGYFNKNRIPTILDSGSPKEILKKLLGQDDKLVEVERRAEKASKERKAEKRKAKASPRKLEERILPTAGSLVRGKTDSLKREQRETLRGGLKREPKNTLKR